MPDPLTTNHFPIPVRVENQDLNVQVINSKLKISDGNNYFSAENTHSNGQATPAHVEIGGTADEYLISTSQLQSWAQTRLIPKYLSF